MAFFFPLFLPTLLYVNIHLKTSSWSGSVVWCLRHLMTSVDYSITIFIPLTRLLSQV